MEIKELRIKYKEVVGKNPFNGWNAKKIIEKMLATGMDPKELTEVGKPKKPEDGKSINDWQLLLKGICDKLYGPVMDAKYRRAILDSKLDDNLAKITSKEDVISELEKIKGILQEGHLKALVVKYIDKIEADKS